MDFSRFQMRMIVNFKRAHVRWSNLLIAFRRITGPQKTSGAWRGHRCPRPAVPPQPATVPVQQPFVGRGPAAPVPAGLAVERPTTATQVARIAFVLGPSVQIARFTVVLQFRRLPVRGRQQLQ